MRNFHITPKDDHWQAKRPNAQRASKTFETQSEAEDWAKEQLRNTGGGEAVIHRPDGRIRDKDTIPPAKDPFPPRDRIY